MSALRCRFAARSGRRSLTYALVLLLAAGAVFLLPAFALAFAAGDSGGCLCQSPQPPGDALAVVAFLDVSHGWLACGTTLLTTACGLGVVNVSALTPRGCPWTVASDGRPPPLGA